MSLEKKKQSCRKKRTTATNQKWCDQNPIIIMMIPQNVPSMLSYNLQTSGTTRTHPCLWLFIHLTLECKFLGGEARKEELCETEAKEWMEINSTRLYRRDKNRWEIDSWTPPLVFYHHLLLHFSKSHMCQAGWVDAVCVGGRRNENKAEIKLFWAKWKLVNKKPLSHPLRVDISIADRI